MVEHDVIFERGEEVQQNINVDNRLPDYNDIDDVYSNNLPQYDISTYETE